MQILASLDLRIAEDGDLVVDLLPAGLIVCLMLFQTGVNEKLRKRGSNLVQCGIGACAQGFVNRRWELRGHLIQSLEKGLEASGPSTLATTRTVSSLSAPPWVSTVQSSGRETYRLHTDLWKEYPRTPVI